MTKPGKAPAYLVEESIHRLTRRRDALLKRLAAMGPFMSGSLVRIQRTCGNKEHCHCGRGGAKHESLYLTYLEAGKTHTLYIPVDLEKEARRWSDDYKKLKILVRQICELQRAIIRRHVLERRRQSR
jgi:hypothetical protein